MVHYPTYLGNVGLSDFFTTSNCAFGYTQPIAECCNFQVDREITMDMAAKVPGDFHALYDRAARAARGVAVQAAPAERAGVSRMAAEVPGLDVHLDEATHN